LNNREPIDINRGNEENLVYQAFDNDDVLIDNQNDDWMAGVNDVQYVRDQHTDDMNDVEVRWDKTHDFSVLHHTYDINIDTNDISVKYDEILKLSRVVNRREVCKSRLNVKQRMAHDLIVRAMTLEDGQSKTDGGNDVSRLQLVIGKGGAGKSYVLDSVISTLKRDYGKDDDTYLVMAPTGKAASNICGSTIHSHDEGLSLPTRGKLNDLKGERLKYLQNKYKNLELVIMDEFTMISQKILHYVDRRLRQITTVNKPFGGLVLVLFGDPGQLPPVGSNSLWINISTNEDLLGYLLYSQFDDVIILEENNRLDKNDDDAVLFDNFLNRLRDGINTEDDWNILRTKCSYCSIGHAGWVSRGFEGNDVIHLYTTNKEVSSHNHKKIMDVGNPIALIEVEHTGKGKSMKDEAFGGLTAKLYLCVGSKVLLTRNLLNIGLSHGSTGIVKDMVYDDDRPPPKLPKFAWVDFGTDYTGPSFFPNDVSRKGWVPVHPVTNKTWTPNVRGQNGYVEHTRKMLPLKLCWAWTIWKAQGMTIPTKVVVSLTDKEREHGLTYVALSRVTKFSNLGIKDTEGLSKHRLCTKIRKHPKMTKRLDEEKRLRQLEQMTLEYFK
jgi:hypothetical protein